MSPFTKFLTEMNACINEDVLRPTTASSYMTTINQFTSIERDLAN